MAGYKGMEINRQRYVSLIPGLPNKIGLLCLARIPLCYRYKITCVCRGWRYLFQEESFWDVRRELSYQEEVLLFCAYLPYKEIMWFGFYTSSRTWFRLPVMPDDGRVNGSSEFAVVHEKLFVIGGYTRSGHGARPSKVSSTVSYFDMKMYQWKRAAPLILPRRNCAAGVIGNQLYVCGGFSNGKLTDTMEVYCPGARMWRFVSSLKTPRLVRSTITLNNKLYVAFPSHVDQVRGPNGAVYDPEKDKWSDTSDGLKFGWNGRPVEYAGRLCVKKDSWDDRNIESSVLAYNPSKDTWEVINSIKASKAELRSCIWSPDSWYLEDILVNVGRSLYTLHKSREGPGLRFEMFDIARKLVASKSFFPQFLEEIQPHCLSQLPDMVEWREGDDEMFQYKVMTI